MQKGPSLKPLGLYMALRLFSDRRLSDRRFSELMFPDLYRDIHIPRPAHTDVRFPEHTLLPQPGHGKKIGKSFEW